MWLCGLVLAAGALVPARGDGSETVPEAMVAFARDIETSLSSCETALFESSVDFDALLTRGTADLQIPDEVRGELVIGVARGFVLGDEICKAVQSSGRYDLLRVRRVEGEPRALFRIVSNSGFNYHDLLLSNTDQGGVAIVDLYVLSLGEWVSRTARRGFLPFVARLEEKAPDRFEPGESLFVENLPSILSMQQHYRQGDFEGALEVFDSMPDDLKKHRNILMTRLAIALEVGGEAYDAAMRDLKTNFPGDPGLDLVLVDHYFNEGQFARTLEILARIDRWVGGDPYLDFVRANVLYADGRPSEARDAARRAIEREPGLEDPYWTLVTISLDQGDFAETAKLLSEIEGELGIVVGDLSEIPEYAQFVKSEAYTTWLTTRTPD
jgi:tetratricopeptide (TPR) repeat protein